MRSRVPIVGSRARLGAAGVLLSLALLCAAPQVAAGGPSPLVAGHTPAPPRHVGFAQNCPPNGQRRAPPIQPPDRDVDHDGRPDYFMGSWTFVGPRGYALVITLWCLKRPPATRLARGHRRVRHYNDEFALQIATRATSGAALVTRVAPLRPICPFVDGVNLGLGFRSHACSGIAQPPFDRIPPVITWISVNRHAAGDHLVKLGAIEHLYWPEADGRVAQGRIVRTVAHTYRFQGSFVVAGALKPAAGLSVNDRQLLTGDMLANIHRAFVEDRGCASPHFG
ncbi:MAG TPA: hypothetical protein VGY97_10725 [Solirubrobacteraceae bacterium]|nr:hypothetical protein [Solirubrobacteraceae bacterium]